MFLKIKKIIGLGAALVCVIAGFYSAGMDNTYIDYSRFPNPETNRTVPYAIRNIVVYITKEDQEFLSWLLWVQIISGGVALLVLLIHRGDPFRSEK
ncbi:hypothetical protein C8R32_1236 [Nitrosospira sp. Nsp5]|uniref:Uncharacterized protein n=1 Tax=Nitrosospira multiformis TaxID=1231 RepID=A0ABY0TDH9_9PROT|nr:MULTISPECIES: hypothetical protein [Nitrosospira]PTR05342.1 hypothetical protein C8R32_1236 [Nitrosospira sp. Nsp5]SDQ66797.1 hypothetical protein SAMN05216402_1772 [Nitrosospira multiformis]